MVKRFEVWNIRLNPTVGHEINKVRPGLIVSPNEVNKFLKTVIIIPLTSTIKAYPTRVDCMFRGKKGQLALDQIRALDSSRLIAKMGQLDKETSERVCNTLQVLFKY
jgi:mRNA interferase MazF